MIQRIQSVYLALAALLSASMVVGKLANYVSLLGVTTTLSALFTTTTTPTMELPISINYVIIIGVVTCCTLALAALFLFRNRKTQMLLCNIGTLVSILLTLYLAYVNNQLIEQNNIQSFDSGNFRLFTPIVCMMLFILAYKGIKKDDDLIKSADRLR